jgi:hypothetical protein
MDRGRAVRAAATALAGLLLVAYGHGGRFPGYGGEAWTDPVTSRSVVVLASTADRSVLGTFDAVIESALCG